MSRELKFRAWNGKEILHNFVVVRPQASDCLSIMTDEKFAERTYKLKEWKIMQFTGLKDKNGKEIYEGDVISIIESKPRPSQRGEIKWSDKLARFTVKNNKGHTFGLGGTDAHIMILGNIYENPDLLTK